MFAAWAASIIQANSGFPATSAMFLPGIPLEPPLAGMIAHAPWPFAFTMLRRFTWVPDVESETGFEGNYAPRQHCVDPKGEVGFRNFSGMN